MWVAPLDRNGTNGVRLIVQGGRHPKHVEARIDAFLKDARKELERMSDVDYEKHVQVGGTEENEKAIVRV